MISSENLFFIYRENLSTHMKESLRNFCFVVKLCVQMNQNVQEISLLEIFLLTQKITHKIQFEYRKISGK